MRCGPGRRRRSPNLACGSTTSERQKTQVLLVRIEKDGFVIVYSRGKPYCSTTSLELENVERGKRHHVFSKEVEHHLVQSVRAKPLPFYARPFAHCVSFNNFIPDQLTMLKSLVFLSATVAASSAKPQYHDHAVLRLTPENMLQVNKNSTVCSFLRILNCHNS